VLCDACLRASVVALLVASNPCSSTLDQLVTLTPSASAPPPQKYRQHKYLSTAGQIFNARTSAHSRCPFKQRAHSYSAIQPATGAVSPLFKSQLLSWSSLNLMSQISASAIRPVCYYFMLSHFSLAPRLALQYPIPIAAVDVDSLPSLSVVNDRTKAYACVHE